MSNIPSKFQILIEKCENVSSQIELCFRDHRAPKVRDLYIEGDRRSRTHDFLKLLNATPNRKKKGTEKRDNELQGLYIFGEKVKNGIEPIYVGISRTIFRRLTQHAFGKSHNETSFCYLKAKRFDNYIGLRSAIDEKLIKLQQQKLQDYYVMVIPERNDYDLYFMEVYIAGRFNTKWNNFKTH